MTWEQITVVIVDLWSVLNHDAFVQKEVAQTWKYKTSTASTSSLRSYSICASIKQICKVTMRSLGCIFVDSCCLLKTCWWITKLWTKLWYIGPPPPHHLWAPGFVAVSWHRDGKSVPEQNNTGEGFCCMTSIVWACCSLSEQGFSRLEWGTSVMVIRKTLISKGTFQTSLLLLYLYMLVHFSMCRVLCSNGPATHLDLAPPLCVPGGLGPPHKWCGPRPLSRHGGCGTSTGTARPWNWL